MNQKRLLLLTVIVLLVAFALRAHRVAYDSVWWDEGVSVWMSRKPIGEMLLATANDTHPPLSYIFLNGWMSAVGEEEFSLRMLSVFFGTLTVAVAYKIGEEAGDRRVGLLTALLTAAAAITVWWSQEIRMYAQVTFFAVLALWSAIRVIQDAPHFWRWVVVLGLSTAGGLLSMYLFAGTVIALNVAFGVAWLVLLILGHKPFKRLLGWGASQALALVFFIPWITYALQYAPTWSAVEESISLGQVGQLYLSTIFLAIGTNIEQLTLIIVGGALLLVTAAGMAFYHADGEKRLLWIVLSVCVIVPPLLVYVLALPRAQFYRPTPSPRYFVMLAVPVYGLLAWGLIRLGAKIRYAGALLTIGLLAVFGWSLNRYYAGLYLHDDYISMVEVIEAYQQEGDVVLLNNDTDWPIFAYHYDQTFEKSISKTIIVRDDKYAGGLLDPYRNNNTGLWLVQTQYAPVTDPSNQLTAYLDSRSWAKRTFDFPEGQVIFYALRDFRAHDSEVYNVQQWPEAFTARPLEVTDNIRIEGAAIPVSEIRAGSTLAVGVGWEAEARDDALPGIVQIVDGQGNVITQHPLELSSAGPFREYQPVEVFIPADAPTGSATIAFAYDEVWHSLGTIDILPPPQIDARVELPNTASRFEANFGDLITLVAIDATEQRDYTAGESIPLTLFWQARQAIPAQYKVFVHVVGSDYNPESNNFVWGQQDQQPQGGEAPTTSWVPGTLIMDDYLIPISEDAPPGTYDLIVGLYDPVTGARLPVADGDSVRLFTIEVED